MMPWKSGGDVNDYDSEESADDDDDSAEVKGLMVRRYIFVYFRTRLMCIISS
jgi:hypothetical protein